MFFEGYFCIVIYIFFVVIKLKYLVFLVDMFLSFLKIFVIFDNIYFGYYYGYLESMGVYMVDWDGIYLFFYNIEVNGEKVIIILRVNGVIKFEMRFDGCYFEYDDIFVVIVLELFLNDKVLIGVEIGKVKYLEFFFFGVLLIEK